MNVAKVGNAIFASVQPAIYAVAVRLFVLTTDRKGSGKYKPTVSTFYETGLVTAIYEHLLMMPSIAHLEIRHEMPYRGVKGAPKRVDLWIRPPNGGYAHLVEAGDFTVAKVRNDLMKIKSINPNGANWFLAFFRERPESEKPLGAIRKSFQRKNGLDNDLIDYNLKYIRTFQVYRPDGNHESFSFALFRAK
jgi:hypothetical protein